MLVPISLYIHFPWCIKKCPYCDFNSYSNNGSLPEEEYIKCLLKDFKNDLHLLQDRPIHSIFMGGGTPSLFSPESMGTLLRELQSLANFSKDIEITLETNPGTTEHHDISEYCTHGINRFSVGAQSFNDAALKKLGRIHHAQDTIDLIQKLNSLNLRSYNIDIMHNLPGQTPEQLLFDINTAIELGAPHISWYQLTIEPNTVFAKYPPVLPEFIDDIKTGISNLASAGLYQYEVSAFSKPSHQCMHNLNYWNFGDYLGIGAGAHGKVTNLTTGKIQRTWKTRNPADYLKRPISYCAGERILTNADLAAEFMLNQLRLHQSFTLQHFSKRTGLSHKAIYDPLEKAANKGLLKVKADTIETTDLGKNFLNDLIQIFLDSEYAYD